MLYVNYPACGTCKRAKGWLEQNGFSYQDRNIKEDNPSYEELKLWYEKSRLDIKKLFNTSGLLYKSLNLKEKLPDMTEDEKLRLLATDGMLVKRPIVIKGDLVLVGFKEDEWEIRLLHKL